MTTTSDDEKRLEVWNHLQEVEYESYRNGEKGVFSDEDSTEGKQFGDFLREMVTGLCLDVGCGLLPEPIYMRNQPNIRFCGIDPFTDPVARTFEFKCGKGELIPYDEEEFDAVIFASSIDHMINPQVALEEAFRVMEWGGLLVVWYSERQYPVLKCGYVYNKHHQWGFTHNTLTEYIRHAGFDNPIVNQKIESVGEERILWVYK